MSAQTALALVSHSAQLAAGTAEVAKQMAPDVLIRAAGGTDDGRIGTSFDLVDQALTSLLDDGATSVVVLSDLGSAQLIAESVLEFRDGDPIEIAAGPFVEGAVAGAVAAQSGADMAKVVATIAAAAETLIPASMREASGEAERGAHVDAARSGHLGADSYADLRTENGEEASTEVGGAAHDEATHTGTTPAGSTSAAPASTGSFVLRNSLGLHARPAAQLARTIGELDAEVTINGVNAASVLALIGLGLQGGATVDVVAHGPQAQEALELIRSDIESGFGEL